MVEFQQYSESLLWISLQTHFELELALLIV